MLSWKPSYLPIYHSYLMPKNRFRNIRGCNIIWNWMKLCRIISLDVLNVHTTFKAAAPKVWSQYRQQHHHLGMCEKCNENMRTCESANYQACSSERLNQKFWSGVYHQSKIELTNLSICCQHTLCVVLRHP